MKKTEKPVSEAQVKKFFALKKKGIIGYEEMKAFLANPKKFSPKNDLLSLKEAKKILGEAIITQKQVNKSWKLRKQKELPKCCIPYTAETLQTVAEQNDRKPGTWYLMYLQGCSLQEQILLQPQHFEKQEWLLDPLHTEWYTAYSKPGYYLINLQDIGRYREYFLQIQLVSKDARNLEILPLHLCAEVLITCQKLSLSCDIEMHRSDVFVNRHNICLGYTDEYADKITFIKQNPSYAVANLGMMTMKKFDIV